MSQPNVSIDFGGRWGVDGWCGAGLIYYTSWKLFLCMKFQNEVLINFVDIWNGIRALCFPVKHFVERAKNST